MGLTRRAWLAATAVLGTAGGLGWLWWRPRRAGPVDGDSVRALVDTLVPDDGDLPGAVALGVDRRLLERVRHRRGLRRNLALLLDALDKSSPPFAALDAEARADRLRRTVEAPRTPPRLRRAFLWVRDAVMTEFYTDPRSWASVGYAGPPQPRGYPDHTRPFPGPRADGC